MEEAFASRFLRVSACLQRQARPVLALVLDLSHHSRIHRPSARPPMVQHRLSPSPAPGFLVTTPAPTLPLAPLDSEFGNPYPAHQQCLTIGKEMAPNLIPSFGSWIASTIHDSATRFRNWQSRRPYGPACRRHIAEPRSQTRTIATPGSTTSGHRRTIHRVSASPPTVPCRTVRQMILTLWSLGIRSSR